MFISFSRVTFALILSITLGACQNQTETPPPSESQIHNLATEVQRQALSDLALFKACASLGGALGDYANTARETWTFSNQRLVEAADRHMQAGNDDWVSWREETYSLSVLALVKDIQQSQYEQLNLAQRGPSGQKSVCRRELAIAETRIFSDLASPQVAQALVAQAQPKAAASVSIVRLSDSFSRWPEPGRSFFALNKQTGPNCSANSRIMPLVNHWPEEVYAHYCNGRPISLIQCQWGKCTRQKAGSAN
ncbi:hypothetical protein [Gilvimarinus xylanilyticus]|uniref:Uncharacterized protein n=1 Tax=Gilvimarinus xylanilyticus TaxID=2944139 RepID=A0A9X2KVV1_9GAMM|nr:hypothetical protein [Gilvimarinus xylanilyticus]MCP8898395.1 hypothetical protein [Gilvimarinus xylanilyticus]